MTSILLSRLLIDVWSRRGPCTDPWASSLGLQVNIEPLMTTFWVQPFNPFHICLIILSQPTSCHFFHKNNMKDSIKCFAKILSKLSLHTSDLNQSSNTIKKGNKVNFSWPSLGAVMLSLSNTCFLHIPYPSL